LRRVLLNVSVVVVVVSCRKMLCRGEPHRRTKLMRVRISDYGLLADSTPQELKLNLTQRYVFKSAIPFKSKGGEKTMNSLVTLKLNPEGKIKYHDEEWNHEDNKDADDGFMGKVQEARKKVDAKLVEATVSSDPSKVNS